MQAIECPSLSVGRKELGRVELTDFSTIDEIPSRTSPYLWVTEWLQTGKDLAHTICLSEETLTRHVSKSSLVCGIAVALRHTLIDVSTDSIPRTFL